MAVQDGTYLQATASFTIPESSAIQNVWHFIVETTAPLAEAVVQAGVATFLGAFYDYLEGYISDQASAMDLTVDEIQFNATKSQWEVYRRIGEQVLTSFAPTGAGAVLPPGTAGLMQFIPIYRKHSGYKYIGAMTEGANDTDGELITAAVTALANAAAYAISTEIDLLSGTGSLYYIIPVRDAELHNTPNAALVRDRWAYQRRRKQFVGL